MAYGIIVLNINVLPNRYFMNFFILSLIEIPSSICSNLCVQYLGRRFTGLLSYLICIVVSLLAALLVQRELHLVFEDLLNYMF